MRWLIGLVLALLAANLAWWAMRGHDGPLWRQSPTPVVGPDVAVGEPPPRASPVSAGTRESQRAPAPAAGDVVATPTAAEDAIAGSSPPLEPPPSAAGLVVPVQGVAAADLQDTFGDARGGERMHEALDIMAPAGTPVLAVADGRIEKLFDSERGGLTIYQFEPGGTWCYYYAHLQAYAPGLAEGKEVSRGEVIGFVGSSGNADPAAPHLHFAVFALTPERQWWTGTPVNPYPLLAGVGER
ncbi:M23 family metallopeptidase [Luteimonas viscosa]|uniref:M23 family metallopeptidase n=1 Tax=Luteimonas viscosa TaxID=1132694 RepID=A0A5D4XQA4_9GAMM|nr:M23 family metallopeptidase [Luteimonas viscosa]TYT26133.1 M23 family metallopeptidase [Luteimonas viscosa]